MAFNPQPTPTPMSEINVTPLVDVMLVLLVVFLVTAPLLTQTVNVALPKTAATRVPTPRDVPLAINRQGEIFLDRRPVALDGLETILRDTYATSAATNLVIQADDQVSFGAVARVMALAQRAGIARLSVVTLTR